jgi:2-dehydropantoate 2-reductase
MTLRVAVFGAGAIGSFYGARLSDGGASVSLIARGRRLEAIRERGLTITTPIVTRTYTLPATDDPAAVGPVDIVLFTVKSYDTTDAAERLRPLLHATTGVISLQNGIDNEDRIAEVIGREHVLGGAAYILAAVREPGVVEAGGPLAMVIGELDGGPPSDRIRAVLDIADRAGLAVRPAEDIRVALWEKYTLLVAFSAMTGTVRLPIGAIRESAAATEMLRMLMAEVWAVGRAEGVPLADALVDRQMGLLLAQDAAGTTSLYHDLVGGHRMELEALQGTAIRLARRHGIATPALDAAYAILQPWAMLNERAAVEPTPVAT